jgi:opacity protein-like surface antigen
MKIRLIPSIIATAVAFAAASASAEDFHRSQKFETFAVGQWEGADKSGILNFGKDFGGGLGVGYNLTDHFNVNVDAVFSKVSVGNGATIAPDTTHIRGCANLDYNIFQGPLTPFITGGIGVNNYDGSQGTFKLSKSELEYKVGAGLRWDINKVLFAKGLYRTAWSDIRNSERFHTVSIMLGVKF